MIQHDCPQAWFIEVRQPDGTWGRVHPHNAPVEFQTSEAAQRFAQHYGTLLPRLTESSVALSLPLTDTDVTQARRALRENTLRLAVEANNKCETATPSAAAVLIGHAAIAALETSLGRSLRPTEIDRYIRAYARLARSAQMLAAVLEVYDDG